MLAIATVVERIYGSGTAYETIYSAVWFKILWGVLSFCGIYTLYKVRNRLRVSVILLHAAFLVILAGALVTSLTATEQLLHLRQGESNSELPFKLTLKSFEIKTYPGTDRPQDYVSHVTYTDDGETANYDISMNHILNHRGYRIYQTSYDDDMRGTFLTVRHDPWGITLTYTGYLLLLVSMLWVLADKSGTFRRLLRECMAKGIMSVALLATLSQTAEAQTTPSPRAISEEKAATLARKQVVYNGRIVPIRTLALDFCQKVTGKRNFGGLSAERFMLSLMLYPDDWRNVRMIKIEDAELRTILGIEGKHGALADFFTTNGEYRLRELYARHKATDDKMENAILKVDERCSLIVTLINGQLVTAVPHGAERPSEALVNAELVYDYAPWSLILFIFTFLLSVTMLAAVISGKMTKLHLTLNVLVALDAIALCSLYCLRWIIQQHIPLSNGYETMLFIALTAIIMAEIFALWHIHKVGLFTVLSLLVAAFALLVSHLSFMSPEMTPLMPVLQSPLLTLHVSVVMVAYALFALMTLISATAIILCRYSTEHYEHMTLVCRLLLYPATFLLGIGIFLGAVWANVSWGTYWSWDPKETWALITFMVYAAPMHKTSIGKFNSPKFYHIYIVGAFLTVLITYFGVNYLLGGMHSYA